MNIVPLVIIVLIQILLVYFYIATNVAFNDNILINGIPIHLIAVILLNITSLYILTKIYHREEKRKIEQTEVTHTEEFRSLVASVRSDRHDLNNHLTVISGLMKINNFEAANHYIEDMIGEIRINNKALTIENPILASMLYSKMDIYRRQEILFELNISSEEIVKALSSTDLIRLLSNLLDNAFEATIELPKEQRKIYLDIHNCDKTIKVIVKNTANLEEIKEEYFEPGFSTKSQGEKRGFGLAIIQDIIKKYNGTLETSSHDNLVKFEIQFSKE